MLLKSLGEFLRVIACILVCFFIVALDLPAQRLGPAPKRPTLPAALDTNDAEVYHDYAMDIFDRDPAAAAAGFYWAARIQPEYASALYGRRAAIIASRPELLENFQKSSPNVKVLQEWRAVDSLYLRALKINPFLYTRLDKRLFEIVIRERMLGKSLRRRNEMDRGAIEMMTAQFIDQSGPQMRAWAAYNDGAFHKALELSAEALKTAKVKAPIHVDRARTFGILGDADSSVAEFTRALEEMRQKDAKDLVRLYNSKAMLEQSIGTLYEHASFTDEAREAYGRALQEDLGFYPAHVRLGAMAAAEQDTATALSELSLAVQIAPDEPQVHFAYGTLLLQFGRSAESIAQLKEAIEQEPFYARPYPQLVALLEKSGDRAAALAACERFLLIASRRDADRTAMTQKRLDLMKALAGSPL